jgi:hypothetical protein
MKLKTPKHVASGTLREPEWAKTFRPARRPEYATF